jgi:hypothetical protein
MIILKQKTNSFVFLVLGGVLGACFLYACGDDSTLENQIKSQSVSLKINRFDIAFKNADSEDFLSLKTQYPFFFPVQTPDSIWNAKLLNPIEDKLLEEVGTAFQDFSPFKENLEHLFKHVLHEYPNSKTPEIFTLTSEVDYMNKVIVTDSIWLLALDNYLGSSHEFYQSFPKYIKDDLDKKYLVIDVAAALSAKYVPRSEQAYFLSKMVYEGKKLLMQSLLWPHASHSEHLHYTEQEYQWALENEAQVWRNFIENQYLYSTQPDLALRFLFPAPFSKFKLDIDTESPGRIGQFMGLQLTKAYYYKHGEDLEKLLRVSAVDLLKDASYKPKK